MAIRALIIAIENYASMTGGGLAQQLPGTHANARKFCTWLIDVKGVAVSDIFVCTDAATFPGQITGASAGDIDDTIHALVTAGKDQTEELYILFSGHGFAYEENAAQRLLTDVLIAADFKNPDTSGRAMRELAAIQAYLRIAMGPGDHFFFVDACRNRIAETDIAPPAPLGLRPIRSAAGDADRFTLFSTRLGAFADVESGFAHQLLDGLAGSSTAKAWDDDGRLVVHFDSLHKFVRSRLEDQEVDGLRGRGDGVIREFDPIPNYQLTIKVKGAEPEDGFDVELELVAGRTPVRLRRGRFSRQAEFQLEPLNPQRYIVKLRTDEGAVHPKDGQRIDLFDDATIEFTRTEADIVPSGASASSLEPKPRLGLGLEILTDSSTRGIEADDAPPIDTRPAKRALRSRFADDNNEPRALWFSETLGGATRDEDLSVWLALLGAAPIIGGPNDFQKLRSVPLADFSQLPPEASPVYVLAVVKQPGRGPRVGLTTPGQATRWQSAKGVDGVPGLRQQLFLSDPGPQLLSIQRPKRLPLTVVSHALANRATLITVCDTEADGLRVHQYCLPIHHLRSFLPSRVTSRFGDNPLAAVRFLSQAQRRFALERLVAPEQGDELRYWQDLLFAKWLEPMTAIIAAYELVRRGQLDQLDVVVDNLRQFFPDIPDIEVLAHLAKRPDAGPVDHPPLLLEGLLSLANPPVLPLPQARLQYALPWTSWRTAPDS